jgi:hypothetical protein
MKKQANCSQTSDIKTQSYMSFKSLSAIKRLGSARNADEINIHNISSSSIEVKDNAKESQDKSLALLNKLSRISGKSFIITSDIYQINVIRKL